MKGKAKKTILVVIAITISKLLVAQETNVSLDIFNTMLNKEWKAEIGDIEIFWTMENTIRKYHIEKELLDPELSQGDTQKKLQLHLSNY